MKPTGRFNQFTNQEIMQVEEHDILWRPIEFEELSDNEIAEFLSFINVGFYSKENKWLVKDMWEYYRDKNLMDL